uniref:Uncharacterized protein n=1 Tax=Cacopsylla melanoneura TaxID=428564 RepID=A0A8D8VKD6_9HEMI
MRGDNMGVMRVPRLFFMCFGLDSITMANFMTENRLKTIIRYTIRYRYLNTELIRNQIINHNFIIKNVSCNLMRSILGNFCFVLFFETQALPFGRVMEVSTFIQYIKLKYCYVHMFIVRI